MWFDELLANWKEALVGGLTGYILIKDIIGRMPNFSLSKKLERSTTMQISSANVVFGKVEDLISLVKTVITENKEKNAVIDYERKENSDLKGVITTLLVNTNVPLEQKESWYKAIKSIEGVATETKEALYKHIELEKQNEAIQVQYDETLDAELESL